MFPVNKPNQYNQPKAKANPLELKHGSYFWLSRLLGTYSKERFKEMQDALEKIKQNASEQQDAPEKAFEQID
jgi:hypothetical protein